MKSKKSILFVFVFLFSFVFAFQADAGNVKKMKAVSDAVSVANSWTGEIAEVDSDGNFPVKERGSKAEDAAHTSGDYLTPVGFVRADLSASTAGTAGDYAAPLTDANGAVYVNPKRAATSTKAVCGDFVTTPKTIVPAGATGKKARVVKLTFQSLAAEVFTITEIPGLTTVNTAAGVPAVIDLGAGIVQTTAATAITAVTADTSSALVVAEYSYE